MQHIQHSVDGVAGHLASRCKLGRPNGSALPAVTDSISTAETFLTGDMATSEITGSRHLKPSNGRSTGPPFSRRSVGPAQSTLHIKHAKVVC